MEYIKIQENGINIVFGITDDKKIKLFHFSAAEFDETLLCKPTPLCKKDDADRRDQHIYEGFQLVQVNMAGYDRPYEKHGNKYCSTAPGYLYKFAGMEDTVNEIGRCLVITQEDNEVTHTKVETTMQFYNGTKVVRFKNKVTNLGEETQT